MELKKQEKLYKQYLAYERRSRELEEELKKFPLIPLEKPIQHGWKVYFDFRDDIKNRNDYPVIKQAFDLVHKEGYTRNVKYIKRIRADRSWTSFIKESENLKKWRWGVIPQLVPIPQHAYDKLPDNIKKWFILDVYYEKWASFRGHQYRLDIPRFWLILKTRPYIITHRRLKGGPVEKEYEFIRKKLRDLWLVFAVDYSSSYPAYKDRTKVRSAISKFHKGEVEDIFIEKIPREYDW